MAVAEIIAIGTEILLGEIQDTNTWYLAQTFRDQGIDLYWTSSVGDNEDRIAAAIQLALSRSDIVITGGGLGPTVDDVTRQSVARAFQVDLEFREDLWKQIKNRYQRYGREPTENNRRQAYVPAGALGLENPVGTAPAFILESGQKVVISLPGVPRELMYLMENTVIPYLHERFPLDSVIVVRLLHTSGVGESQIDERIADLETLTNPTVGLAAHSGQVDVRITAKANTHEKAERLINSVETEIRQRLGDWIYGVDEDTLANIALDNLAANNWSLAMIEAGLHGELIRQVANHGSPFTSGQILPPGISRAGLQQETVAYRHSQQVAVCLGISLTPGKVKQHIEVSLITPDATHQFVRSYGGPPEYAQRWAANLALHLLRSNITAQTR